MLRRYLPITLATVLCWGALATAAQAKPVRYVVQVGNWTRWTSLTLDGDRITDFTAQVKATSCTAGSQISSDDRWGFRVTTPTTLTNGGFSFGGTATSVSYAQPGENSTGTYSVTGHVSPDHQEISGTITLTGADDVFLQGCSATEHFFAIPKRPLPQRNPASTHADYQGQFISFNDRNGVITDLRLEANFMCSESVDDAAVYAAAYGHPVIRTDRSGQWSMRGYVLDSLGSIIYLDVSGRVDGRKASGHFRVTEPAGLAGIGGRCHGNTYWSAARPTPPAPPGPGAYFTWEALRAPVGAGYRYYFYASGLTCTNGANAVQITIAHRTTTIACAAQGGWASGPLTPGQTYESTAVAVELRGHRIIKRGTPVPEPLSMPGPDDRWQPVGHFPTPPPA